MLQTFQLKMPSENLEAKEGMVFSSAPENFLEATKVYVKIVVSEKKFLTFFFSFLCFFTYTQREREKGGRSWASSFLLEWKIKKGDWINNRPY
jgi:hypothetical protein